MNPDGIRVPAAPLVALIARMFAAVGLSPAAAERVAAGLVEADPEGASSHGVMLVDMYTERIRHGFRARAAQAAERVRGGRRAPGADALFAPGEPEWRRRAHSGDQVLLAQSVVEMRVRIAGELGVSTAPFDANMQTQVTGHAQA